MGLDMYHYKCEEDDTEFDAKSERGYCPECGRRAIRQADPPAEPDRDSGSADGQGDRTESKANPNDSVSDSTERIGDGGKEEGGQERTVPQRKGPNRKATGSRGGPRTVAVKASPNAPRRLMRPASSKKAIPKVTKKVVTNKDKAKEHEDEYETTWSRIRKVAGF